MEVACPYHFQVTADETEAQRLNDSTKATQQISGRFGIKALKATIWTYLLSIRLYC